MMTSTPLSSSANFCALAKIVSNAGLQRMMFEGSFHPYGRKMKMLLKKTGVNLEKKSSFSELLAVCHTQLLQHYRHEYLYKAALLNSYVLHHYSLEDSILLNEFKIGNSKADAVLINGTNKVFEIKTELDSPDRLLTQVNDYYKAFSEVYIVIHHSAVDKYIGLIDEHVGILLLSPKHTITTLRSAQCHDHGLDIPAMMKALRKEEYLQVVKNLCGSVPIATPVQLFKSCLNVLLEFSAIAVQTEFLRVIKQRINPLTNQLVQNPLIPDALRFSCYSHNLNENDYLSLIDKLNYKI
ncbi:sce7726 family protein [Pedobacter gandavensis]|uniref:sce7726 family protein n=1 Tax=Pedobacter TaxID=84567 RepID=UPI001C990562|nr:MULTISPECIES: sce7726 family protein [Pedobacter]WGQ12411.1 sce7726 family protein [Pedobacter gandavensis]